MYIFNGKLNWFASASNECFTLVFPAGFALNDPVSAFWQWSVDPCCGKENVNSSLVMVLQHSFSCSVLTDPLLVKQCGIITGVCKTGGLCRLTVPLDLYTFEVTIAADGRSATLSNQQDTPTTLALCYSDCIREPTAAIYTGKLNYGQYAKDEMITLVVPAGIFFDAPVGFYYQWTVDDKGVPKRNQVDVGTFCGVDVLQDGSVVGAYKASYYIYEFNFPPKQESVTITMSAPDNLGPDTFTLERVTWTKSRGSSKKVCPPSHGSDMTFCAHADCPMPGADCSFRQQLRLRHLHGEGHAHQVPRIRGCERRDAVLRRRCGGRR